MSANDGTARRTQMFPVAGRREQAELLAAILRRCAVLIAAGVKQLKDPAEIARIGREVKLLEEEGDAMYAQAITTLFEGTPNALDVIKWKDIYDNIEHALDECEDVLNVLESVCLTNV